MKKYWQEFSITRLHLAQSEKEVLRILDEMKVHGLIEGANLRNIDFEGMYLVNHDFRAVIFEFANLNNVRMLGCHLEGSNFHRTKLNKAELKAAYLRKAYMLEAQLKEASLYDAECQDAIFESASMNGANLAGARFDRAVFRYTDLRDANLDGAVFIDAQMANVGLHGAKFTKSTIMPDGSNWHRDYDLSKHTPKKRKNLPPNRNMTGRGGNGVIDVRDTTKTPKNYRPNIDGTFSSQNPDDNEL